MTEHGKAGPRLYDELNSSHQIVHAGLAIVVIDMPNDGITPVRLITTPPAPTRGDIFNYDAMLTRVANEYDAAFTRI